MHFTSICFRRTVAATPKHPGAAVAQAASTPLKVRYRRAQLLLKPNDPRKPDEKTVASAVERIRLARLRVAETSERRGRIRGTRRVKGPDGQVVNKVVGQRIYLPNIIFRMVRNNTPPGKPYNPFEATFRIPQSLTKTDVRSYLHAVYGVECTYIRTDNYLPPMEKYRRPMAKRRSAYKRAIVGLVKPFYYPLALEDMDGKERWLREAALEETYRTKAIKLLQKQMTVKQTQKTADDWKLRDGQWDSRSKILRTILRRKEEREQRTRVAADAIAKMREEDRGIQSVLDP